MQQVVQFVHQQIAQRNMCRREGWIPQVHALKAGGHCSFPISNTLNKERQEISLNCQFVIKLTCSLLPTCFENDSRQVRLNSVENRTSIEQVSVLFAASFAVFLV